jgi:hypothetical protein
MTTPELPTDDLTDGMSVIEFLQPVIRHRRTIAYGTLLAMIAAVILCGVYYWQQPIRSITSINFRPVFAGAETGTYPNGLAFAVTDIVDPSITDQVFEKNHVEDYCPRAVFESAMVVQKSSPEQDMLDLDYQARLADKNLTVVDRTRLQDEYRVKLEAIKPQFSLTFVNPPECARIPRVVVAKVVAEVLQTWATDAVLKRGVLKALTSELTPEVFDQASSKDQSLLVRADLVRSTLLNVIGNVEAVQTLPGANLIRMGGDQTSFEGVRLRLESLVRASLDPMIAVAGQALGSDSLRWVQDQLKVATTQRDTDQQRADALLHAIQVYSGVATTPSTAAGARPANPSDLQAVTPQVDRSFIDRIVDLSASAANTAFRQELTRKMIEADQTAVADTEAVDHYTQLLGMLQTSGASTLTAADVAQRLEALIAQGKDLTTRFDALYEEYSRVSFRAASELYQVEGAVQTASARVFRPIDAFAWVVIVGIVATLVLAILAIIQDRFRRFRNAA